MARLFKMPLLLLCPMMSLISCGTNSSNVFKVEFDYPGYQTQYVKKGEKITRPNDPIKEDETKFSYEFDGWYYKNVLWDFDKAVESDMVLKPKFNHFIKSYKITFKNGDQILQESDVRYGDYPSYLGEEPTRESSGDIFYKFIGWDHELERVSGPDTYSALFKEMEFGISFDELDDVYYPYIDAAKNYLTTPNANVHDYFINVDSPNKAIKISWTNAFMDADSLKFEYGTNSDFSESKTLNLSSNTEFVNLYNLLKGTTYFVRVTAVIGNNKYVDVSSFKTTDVGPRVMNIPSIYNTRDLGGYVTENGKKTLQNMIFRGGALLPSTDVYKNSISEEDKIYMSEELGIKSELDLRTPNENVDKNVKESPIPGAKLTYYNINGYESMFTSKSAYAKIFRDLSDKSNYPCYIHCTGGADRTGTICFLINGLLGVSEEDLIHDYEFTSFSIYRERNVEISSSNPYSMGITIQRLKNEYKGNTLSEKIEDYLLTSGLTQKEIDNIKAINLGEENK